MDKSHLGLSEDQGYKLAHSRDDKPDPSKFIKMGGQDFITARDLVGKSEGRATDWKLLEHLESARARKWPFVRVKEFPEGEVAICGSGPSIGNFDQLREIRRLQKRGVKIHAVNRCHDFLISKGIIPDSASLLDPIPQVATYIKPRKGIDYFIGFQCHPDTFDVFDKPEISKFIWYVRTTSAIDSQLEPNELAYATPSRTSTNGLRSVLLHYMRGFRTYHFFGFDSSYETELDANGVEQIKLAEDGKGKLHAHAKPETLHDIKTTRVVEFTDDNTGVAYEREYFSNSAMLCQADEFILLISDIAQGIKCKAMDDVSFLVHGDGLIPDIACSVRYPLHVDQKRWRTHGMAAIRSMAPPNDKPKPKLRPAIQTLDLATLADIAASLAASSDGKMTLIHPLESINA